jgi:curved DNA-binding protein CbpA
MEKLIQNVSTLEELKKVYKKLAFQYHPDRGGDEEVMKKLNNEYDELFEKLKDKHKNKEGEFYTKETEETPNEWRTLISQLIALKMVAVTIEVIGSFLWVSGNTKPYREELKGLGLKWSPKKSSWYQSPAGYRRYTKKDYNMNDIRQMYGSQKVKEKETQYITN